MATAAIRIDFHLDFFGRLSPVWPVPAGGSPFPAGGLPAPAGAWRVAGSIRLVPAGAWLAPAGGAWLAPAGGAWLVAGSIRLVPAGAWLAPAGGAWPVPTSIRPVPGGVWPVPTSIRPVPPGVWPVPAGRSVAALPLGLLSIISPLLMTNSGPYRSRGLRLLESRAIHVSHEPGLRERSFPGRQCYCRSLPPSYRLRVLCMQCSAS
jgi:hypothetical protein